MANTMQLALPPLFINGYIRQQLIDFGLVPDNPDFTPIMPVQPGDISMYYDDLKARSGESYPLFVQYDRLIRFRPNHFYRTKREQILYTLNCGNFDKKEMASRVIIEALDREDATAQDINLWASNNPLYDGTTEIPKNVFFHNFKVYQVDQSRDLVELSSVKDNYWDKIIIEYDYHTTDSYYN
jgi:hypothetical protein